MAFYQAPASQHSRLASSFATNGGAEAIYGSSWLEVQFSSQ